MKFSQTGDLWWKNAVLYCADVQTFADSDGDGFGDGTDPCPAQPESGIDLDPEGCP